jgi:hypothetical protein
MLRHLKQLSKDEQYALVMMLLSITVVIITQVALIHLEQGMACIPC